MVASLKSHLRHKKKIVPEILPFPSLISHLHVYSISHIAPVTNYSNYLATDSKGPYQTCKKWFLELPLLRQYLKLSHITSVLLPYVIDFNWQIGNKEEFRVPHFIFQYICWGSFRTGSTGSWEPVNFEESYAEGQKF